MAGCAADELVDRCRIRRADLSSTELTHLTCVRYRAVCERQTYAVGLLKRRQPADDRGPVVRVVHHLDRRLRDLDGEVEGDLLAARYVTGFWCQCAGSLSSTVITSGPASWRIKAYTRAFDGVCSQ